MLLCVAGFCVMTLLGGIFAIAALFNQNDEGAAAFFVGCVVFIAGLCAAGRTLDDYRVYETYPAKTGALRKQKRENCACSCDCCDKKPREEVKK